MKSTRSTDDSTQSRKQITKPTLLMLGRAAIVVATIVLPVLDLTAIRNSHTNNHVTYNFNNIFRLAQPDDEERVETEWHVNDDPLLYGPQKYWYPVSDGGWDQSDYHYTYGSGGELSAENSAKWPMESRIGNQKIQVYIPNSRDKPSTATVSYEILIDLETKWRVSVAQKQNRGGWVSLRNPTTGGETFPFNGAEATIMVADNDAEQHWNVPQENHDNSRIGVDAIRMQCASNCTPTG